MLFVQAERERYDSSRVVIGDHLPFCPALRSQDYLTYSFSGSISPIFLFNLFPLYFLSFLKLSSFLSLCFLLSLSSSFFIHFLSFLVYYFTSLLTLVHCIYSSIYFIFLYLPENLILIFSDPLKVPDES